MSYFREFLAEFVTPASLFVGFGMVLGAAMTGVAFALYGWLQ